jgi:hypothetical protein
LLEPLGEPVLLERLAGREVLDGPEHPVHLAFLVAAGSMEPTAATDDKALPGLVSQARPEGTERTARMAKTDSPATTALTATTATTAKTAPRPHLAQRLLAFQRTRSMLKLAPSPKAERQASLRP